MDDDLDVVVGWQEHLDSLCSCGHPRVESYDPANDGAYEAVPLQCHACAARDAESRRASKVKAAGEFGDGAFDGLHISVIQVERDDEAEGGDSG